MALTLSAKIIIEALDKASGVFGKIGNNAEALGKSMITIGAGPTVALGLATKAAIDYESAFAGIIKTVDASDSEFDQLSKNIRDIAKESPITANELAGIGEVAGQLGVSGVDNLSKFIETASMLGIATNLSSEEASTAFARISNVMQEPIDNIDRMGSAVVDLGNSMATNESEIVNFAQRIAGAGQIAGLSTPDIFGIGAAMSSVGVEAEAGGTAVQKVLLGINSAVIETNEDLSVFAKTAGISSKEFAETWRAEPGKAFQMFVEGLGTSGDEAIGILSDLGLEDQRLIRSFLSLANAGSTLKDGLDTASKGFEENTALVNEANKRYETTESKLKIAKNRVNDLGIEMGKTLSPAIIEVIDALEPLIIALGNFTEKNPEIVAGVLVLGAGIGALGVAILTITTIVGAFGTALGALGITAAGTMTVLGTIGAFLTGPFFLSVLAIGTAVGLLYLAWTKNWGGIQEKTRIAGEVIRNAVENVKLKLQAVGEFITTLPEVFTQFVESLKAGIYKFFVEDIPYAIGFMVGRFARFVTEDVPNFVTGTIEEINKMPGRISAIFIRIVDAVGQFFTQAKLRAIELTTQLVNGITEWIGTIPGMVDEFISQVPVTVEKWFNQAKDNAINIAKGIYDGVREWIQKTIDFFKDLADWGGRAANKAREASDAGFSAGHRQFGGPVSSAGSYLVGENGPEIFTPSTAGRITPNNQMGAGNSGGGGLQIIINANNIVNSPNERRSFAEAILKDLQTMARAQNVNIQELADRVT